MVVYLCTKYTLLEQPQLLLPAIWIQDAGKSCKDRKFECMPVLSLSFERTNRAYRWAVGCLFFLQGICFASWASRIPSIQQQLNISDTTLGIILFALPVGSMIALPFAGWLVTRFGSKRIVTNAILIYSLLLLLIGFSSNIFLLTV